MAKLKYQKHVVTCKKDNPAHPEISYPAIFMRGGDDWGINFHMNWECICRPFRMEAAAMVHEFDQILCFVGRNVADLFDFQAVIELSLGEEAEKYIITAPTMVYIPKGMPHGPLDFKKIEQPVMFHNIVFSPRYIRKRDK
jgi:hypothetical protein